ncbi:cytochrome p450 [Hirsutella rhossiliensis]|uniref:Cytochrome p450 domain-containing protein n=1 Tax=Hirsutella rhossiliensis TaxID=111463 RepID=A0A9P8N6I1_9HYPO|nr:cytochrome p450 domain-containing protein [Hirsutella rhossiliensis]KAH0967877.1 cytochrome p450 domain-containing protein [Hirsutella rhossiliensis]
MPLLWDTHGTLRRVALYAGSLTSARVSIMGYTAYVFQDRQTVERLWKQPSLSSSIFLYMYSMKFLFGAREQLMSALRIDDSGPFPQPHPDSKIASHNRLHYIIHDSLARGLSGPGLDALMDSYMKGVSRRIHDLQVTEDWTEMDDFAKLLKSLGGESVIEAIFGPKMLDLNPGFVDSLWGFDSKLPKFARGLPSWVMPGAHRNRQRLVEQIMSWYQYARQHSDESKLEQDADGDSVWGSAMMRDRQKTILQVEKQDDDAMARLDLGLAWAAVANAIPSATLSAFHIFKDPELLVRIRNAVDKHLGSRSFAELDIKELTKEPLLSSVYAETLRLYIIVYATVTSPHEDASLGRWLLPKNSLGVLNSGLSHMDTEFWNTKNGNYPVETFWAERFCVDPGDSSSGPIRSECRKSMNLPDPVRSKDGKPFISTRGLEGSWFPYGGGRIICPGRVFAKSLMIFTWALLANEFDVEFYTSK